MSWQPIETAPRDGTTIIVCYARCYDMNGFAPISVQWRAYHPNAEGAKEWRDSNGHRIQGVTHWIPLPPPPEATP